jgi:hypothetical protein
MPPEVVTPPVESPSGPARGETPVPANGPIPAFGALQEQWAAQHVPDPRFEPGCCYDPTPGLGSDERHDAKYYGLIADENGRIYVLSERLPKGTSIEEAEAAALRELPADAQELWRTSHDQCLLVEYQSDELEMALGGGGGGVLVALYSGTGDEPFNERSIVELIFSPYDSPTPSDIEC